MPTCSWKSCPDQDEAYAGFDQKLNWVIENCGNLTEDTYTVQLGAWNPLDGWVWLEKPFVVEVLERIGPIEINDFAIINDANETKEFEIMFERMGIKTCVSVDWGDGTRLQFYGNGKTCKARYQYLREQEVGFIDSVKKQFHFNHKYMKRGLFTVTVTGFDERSYAEQSLDITIFRKPCKVPKVWLPVNHTSWDRPEQIPYSYKSKQYQVVAMAFLECNVTVETQMTWFAYSVSISADPSFQAGYRETLVEVQINETVPTYKSSLLTIPPLTLDYGLYKLVFKLEIETGIPDLPLYRTAYTYVTIKPSPLAAGFVKGSVAKVTRGWGQVVRFDAQRYSLDPDNPGDNRFEYNWWCRRIDSKPPEQFGEEKDFDWVDTDNDGNEEAFPIFDETKVQRIPRPRDPMIIDPPGGCFGYGPGPMKVSSGKLTLNTSSLVTYAQVYEVSLVILKDTRMAQVKMDIDVGIIPAPIVEIECASEGLCFPTYGGIFVNPTSRLALKSLCVEECETGEITYSWNLIAPRPLQTLSCNPEETTTTTTTTTTSTTSTTTTLPPQQRIKIATFHEDITNTTYFVSQSTNGTIIVSFSGSEVLRRRKRQTVSRPGTEMQPLIPDSIPVGCASVFKAGLHQSDFAVDANFFKLNPTLKEFGIEVNVTRCLYVDDKITCSSGVSTLNIKVNDPPYSGKCKIRNIGQTEEDDFTNPGFNTALLDIFHITCNSWKDPNQHLINKYVFKGNLKQQ